MDQTIVIDNGACKIRAGFSGDLKPRTVIPSIFADPVDPNDGSRVFDFLEFENEEGYKQCRNILSSKKWKIRRPFQRNEESVMRNEDKEAIWSYLIKKELKVDPENYNILITESVFTSKQEREQMGATWFEEFKTPFLHIADSGILPLYSEGLTTGIVLDCGLDSLNIYPVWEGYPFTRAIMRESLGGSHVTSSLNNLLKNNRGENSDVTKLPMEIINYIKEKCCFVKSKANILPAKKLCSELLLPDGQHIQLSEDEQTLPGEYLFRPSDFDSQQAPGLHEYLYNSVMKSDMDIRKALFSKIVLTGGCTMLNGFKERLREELEAMCNPNVKIGIISCPDRDNNVWSGASVLSSMVSFSDILISKKDYDEVGPSILHLRKNQA